MPRRGAVGEKREKNARRNTHWLGESGICPQLGLDGGLVNRSGREGAVADLAAQPPCGDGDVVAPGAQRNDAHCRAALCSIGGSGRVLSSLQQASRAEPA